MKIFFVNGIRGGDEVEYALAEITIGREEDNQLRIPTAGVSRYHAKLELDADGKWLVRDLGSTNGVKLNRRRIQESAKLADGDLIEIGDQMIRVTELAKNTARVVFKPLPNQRQESIDPMLTDLAGEKSEKPKSAPPKPADNREKDSDDIMFPTPSSSPDEQHKASQYDLLNDFSSLLKDSPEKLFHSDSETEQEDARAIPVGKPKRKLSNLTFYTIIVCVALVGIVYILKLSGGLDRKPAKAPQQAAVEVPLILSYEKEVLTADNVFRFALLLENDTVEFTVDDLKSHRHFQRKFTKVSLTDIAVLRGKIRDSGIWKMREPERARSTSNITRKIVLAQNPELRQIQVDGQYIPPELETLESAIAVFAENYGFQTISLTPDELMRQAREAVNKANELYDNREAGGTNLRDSILRYRQAVVYLEQFSPAPALLDHARKQLAAAENTRKEKLQDLEYERVRLSELRDLDGMRKIFIQVMDYADSNSNEYDIARQRLFKIDSYLRRQH